MPKLSQVKQSKKKMVAAKINNSSKLIDTSASPTIYKNTFSEMSGWRRG